MEFEANGLFDAFAAYEAIAALMVDLEGRIIKWSTGAQKLYGFAEDEIIHVPLTALFPYEDASLPSDHLAQVQVQRRFHYEGAQKHRDSTLFDCHLFYSSVNDTCDNMRACLVICRDVSNEKNITRENQLFQQRLEQEVKERTRELRVSNEELEAFSYSVSHDLRAPLRAINGFSQVLLEQYASKLDEEGLRLIQVVHWNAELMGELIDDLLKFSRLSKLNLMTSSVNMEAAVNKAITILISDEKTVRSNIKIERLDNCTGDENMLLQVWINLIDNALKYTSRIPKPEIRIGSLEKDSGVEYYIKDNGAGFDMKYADKLFGVFQRLHSHDEFSGTGLGLALVKRIISKHGGEIRAHAEVNKGAEFRFTLKKPQHEHTS